MSALPHSAPPGSAVDRVADAACAVPAIRVDHLGKRYQIYDRPRDRLKQALVPRLLHAIGRTAPTYFREFWALRDVSFEVARGESVGIVGRNGAGKSTLLQIIAGTTVPTLGSVEVHGRVAALLELGSGFSPEFTGRENVWLNGAILGLGREEIAAKFDDIAAFADIGEFLEQPVKTYSTGMVVRLAFAIQTAVSPEILIVDEALSVGDVFFQAKCIARMRKLLADGVTLLYVSHDAATVRQLCNRAVLLHRGRLVAFDSAREVADRYLHMELEERNAAAGVRGSAATIAGTDAPSAAAETEAALEEAMLGAGLFAEKAKFNRAGSRQACFANVQLLKQGKPTNVFEHGDEVVLRQVVRFTRDLDNVNVSYKIRTPQGTDVVFGDTRLVGMIAQHYPAGIYAFEWRFRLDLGHGAYCIMAGLAHPPAVPGEDWRFLDMVPVCYDFRVLPRREGMLDGLVTWHNRLEVHALDVGASSAEAAAAAGESVSDVDAR